MIRWHSHNWYKPTVETLKTTLIQYRCNTNTTVVLKPTSYTRLTALLFAEICAKAGLPPGMFNVVTGNGASGQSLATQNDVDKVASTGFTEVFCVTITISLM